MNGLLTRWARKGRDLSVFAAGALVGFVLAARAGDNARGDQRRTRAPRGSEGRRRLERAWEETLDSLSSVWEWGKPRPLVDVEPLSRLLGELPGGGSVRVYSLAPGIVELVGTASDEQAAGLIAAAEGHHGVTTVVNRIWTGPVRPPSDPGPASTDTVRATPGDTDGGDGSPL